MATLISYALIGWFLMVIGIFLGIVAEQRGWKLLDDLASFLALLGFLFMSWNVGAVIVSKLF